MREPGVEPGRVSPQDPKSCASANSATLASLLRNMLRQSGRACRLSVRDFFPPNCNVADLLSGNCTKSRSFGTAAREVLLLGKRQLLATLRACAFAARTLGLVPQTLAATRTVAMQHALRHPVPPQEESGGK